MTQLTPELKEKFEELSDKYSYYIGDSLSDFEMVSGRSVILPNDIQPMLHAAYTLGKDEGNKWVSVSYIMPPFGTLILLRGVISWKSKNSVLYFSDIVKNDYEILEYGISGYLLENNSDYLVVNHPNPEEVCSEYITHWMSITEPTPPTL